MEISVVRATDAERYLNLDRVVWFEESWTASLDKKLMGVPEDQRFAAEIDGEYVGLYGVRPMELALPGGAMLVGASLPDELALVGGVPQLLVGALVVTATILAVRSRRRLKAVVLTGITGYGTAMLFFLHGAPDLALDQVMVETITLVVFVLVLRRLPAYFSNRPLAADRWLRLAIGIAVGALLFAFLSEQSNKLQILVGVSPDIIAITQGVIVLTVVISYEVVRRYGVRLEQQSVARALEVSK